MTDNNQQTQLTEGSTLGPYEIRGVVGKGGMGIVYRGWDPGLKRDVAVKVLADSLSGDENVTRRFIREARTMATINHENVVPIYYINQERGLIFFSMELIAGRTLRQMISEDEEWSFDQILSITRQIVSGLKSAYKKKIIHRDLKPANIIVDEDNRVRLLDFGLSKILHESSVLTQTGVVLGTPDFMAPEQAEGAAFDHRCDIYSLGATLYTLLRGAPPFEAETPLSVLYKHVHEPLPPLDELSVAIPEGFIRMIYRMMAKNPDERYQEYEQIERELAHIVSSCGSTTVAQPQPLLEARPLDRKKSRRKTGRYLAMLLIFVLIAMFLMVVISRKRVRRKQLQAQTHSRTVHPDSGDQKSVPEAISATTGEPKAARKQPRSSKTDVQKEDRIKTTSIRDDVNQKEYEKQAAELISQARLLSPGLSWEERQAQNMTFLPRLETADRQYALARAIAESARNESDATLAFCAFSRVQTAFPQDNEYVIKSGNSITLILFETRRTQQLVAHLKSMIAVGEKRKYSWQKLNDQYILLGLAEEKLLNRPRKARWYYTKAARISQNKEDPVLVPDGQRFRRVKLAEFLRAKRVRSSSF